MISRRTFAIRSLWVAGFGMGYPFKAFSYDGSGEGTARILEPEVLVAGKKTRVIIEVTVGKSGIPPGGGIWLGVHHAALWNTDYGVWSKFQSNDPQSENYIGVEGDQSANFESTWYGWAPNESIHRSPAGIPDWSGNTPLIFHQCLQAKVKHASQSPGQKVLFTIGNDQYGAVPPIVTDNDHLFFVAVDSNANGVFKGIGEYPGLNIIADKARSLTANAQMVQQTHQPFELTIRTEDDYHNTASSFNGRVTVRSEEGTVLTKEAKLTSGIARVRIKIDRPGPQRLYLEGSQIMGRSDPIMVLDTMPHYKIYVGDIHGHTRVSDGCCEPYEYYEFARDEVNLDVCAISDHRHNDWDLMKAMAMKYYRPGKFVTLLAEESGTRQDHFNIYHRRVDSPHTSRNPGSYEDHYRILEEDYLRKGHKVLGGPHHFAFDRGEKCYPFEKWDDRFARFVEVYSNHGTSEYFGNPRPLNTTDPDKTMQVGLKMGRRFGVVASSDTHVAHPGRSNWLKYRGALAAFLAPALERGAIWDALWDYRVYAMSFDRIYMDFRINDQIMGSELEIERGCHISFEVVGRDESMEVVLVRNNEDYLVETSANGMVKVDLEENAPIGDNFYYLRVLQQNKERGWSTPIWVKRL